MAAIANDAWARELADTTWPEKNAVRLFVAGASTHVGKSTVCLGLLRHCAERFGPKRVAYCKAATQDERPDAVAAWCRARGVACVSGPRCPIVYYAGFTRAFLDGSAGESAQWLRRCEAVVDDLAEGRRVVVVDGVGFPAVGTVCGTSNADVAAALKAPVVLVVKSGVGSAIDNAAYAASFFGDARVPVLGAVLNRSPADGFYARDQIEAPLRAHFSRGRHALYGIVPTREGLEDLRDAEAIAPAAAAAAAEHVCAHVDVARILDDAARDAWNARRPPPAPPVAPDAIIDAPSLRARVQLEAKQLGADVAPRR